MSLEQALAENTAVMKELVAAWKLLTANAVACKSVDTVTAGGVTVTEKAISPKPVTTPAPTPAVAVEATIASVETAAASPSEITYEDVSKAVLAKMKTDKPLVMAAAAKFGVKNAKELKSEQWADFIKEIA